MARKPELTVIVYPNNRKRYELAVGDQSVRLSQSEFKYLAKEVDDARDEIWPGELTRDDYAAIGSAVAASADLEYSVDVLICRLLGLTPRHRSAFLKGQMEGKLQILEDVAKMQLASQSDSLNDLILLISEMRINNTDRNTVVHGLWTTAKATGGHGFLSIKILPEPTSEKRARMAGDPRTITIKQARQLANNICLSKDKLTSFHGRIWPSKKKPSA